MHSKFNFIIILSVIVLLTSTEGISVVFAKEKFEFVDLSKVCNMGFKDEVADDGKGGWTDQGSQNDLRIIPVGEQIFAGISFNIIDPDRNKGKSCIVLYGTYKPLFPKEAVIPVDRKAEVIYFLHTAAWVLRQNIEAAEY